MLIVILVLLLLLAAAFGILGAVLKATLVLVLALLLTVAILAWATWWWVKRRVRAFQVEVDRQRRLADRRRRAIDVRYVPNEADPDRDRELDRGEPG